VPRLADQARSPVGAPLVVESHSPETGALFAMGASRHRPYEDPRDRPPPTRQYGSRYRADSRPPDNQLKRL
jgi:hypothetical protein